jgi:hypothetical protein
VLASLLAVLIYHPLITFPRPANVQLNYEETRVIVTLDSDIQDPIRIYAPKALEIWVNNEKMTCRRYGSYRLATFPILHNQEPCELY